MNHHHDCECDDCAYVRIDIASELRKIDAEELAAALDRALGLDR